MKKVERTQFNKLKPTNIFKRDISNFDDKLFIDDISNWNVNNYTGTDMKFNDFIRRIEDCVERHAPIKKNNNKQLKRSTKPWINNEIIKMIGHRDRLFHRKKDNPLNHRIKSASNLFRNRITREIKKAKKNTTMSTM